MHKELDKFVETDEKVRADLDRKHRVEYLKTKGQDEYQQSIVKLRNSKSPPKKGENSAYQSPYSKKSF